MEVGHPMSLASLRVIPSCTECGLEAGGRCPTCHRYLCMDHFGYEEHHPCRERVAAAAKNAVCYVCGEPAPPRQWSTQLFAHYIDAGKCAGCGRPTCDTHTRVREERVEIHQDALRSHRYYTTRRYCDRCARWRFLGGVRGAIRLGVGVALVAAVAAAGLLIFLH